MNEVSLELAPVRRVRRRVYGRDFKLKVVQGIAQGSDAEALVRQLGISSAMISRWMREWQRDPVHAFRGYGQRKIHQSQMEQLRRQVTRLRAERDLLKKVSARFAMTPRMPSASSQSIEHGGR